LEEFVEEDNNKGSDNELNEKEETDAGTEVRGLTTQSSKDVDGRLVKSHDEGED